MKNKTTFFEVENWEKEPILKSIKELKLEANVSEEKLTLKNAHLFFDCEIISVFIYSKIDKSILNKLPKLRAIFTRSTGFDHIDIAECKKKKIAVYNVPSYGENTVAEYTFGLVLVASRKLLQASERAKAANFDFEGLIGQDLKGKTIGVIGTGKIGKNVIRMADGFEMNVIAYDKFKTCKEVKYVSLKELLNKSDIITLHAPYCKETHHLINRKNLKEIKKGAILINTARGGLVETASIVEGLKNNIFSFVALDVIEDEPLIKEEKELLCKNFDKRTMEILLEDHILMNNPRVIITPHTAFYTKEALERIDATTLENIKSFLKSKSENRIA